MTSLPLLDWTQLGFIIKRVELARSISNEEVTITASSAANLVVVTLEGRSPRPCYVAADSREFAAIYEQPSHIPNSPQKLEAHIVQAGAVGFADEPWIINTPQRMATFSRYFHIPGLVAFRIAVSLPRHVTVFFVRYPAGTQAQLPSPGQN